MILLLSTLLYLSFAAQMVVDKEYVEALKERVTWEVAEYEDNIFRGWTMDEFKGILGLQPVYSDHVEQHVAPDEPLPEEVSWAADECDHGPKNQGNCGSCWAFATAGMLASRCCMHTDDDKGWLSPQELVSCDPLNHACNGGSPYYALLYVKNQQGLVRDECYPYVAKKEYCPSKCKNGGDWKSAHVCQCSKITECKGVNNMRSCLTTGPISVGFGVCQSFTTYKGGIYECDCQGKYLGYHAVLAQGYSNKPSCHWIVRNSWGESWGEKGYFKIACTTCGIDGQLGGANVMCNHVTN